MNFSVTLCILIISIFPCLLQAKKGGCRAHSNVPKQHTSNEMDDGYDIKKWDNGVVKYTFDYRGNPEIFGSLTKTDVMVVQKAMEYITDNIPCITFENRPDLYTKDATDAVQIYKNCTCGIPEGEDGSCSNSAYASLGKGHENFLVIEACTEEMSQEVAVSLITHELLHNIGLPHTQERTDADEHIYIHMENIEDEYQDQYETCKGGWTCDTHDVPYDCMSIMHYRDDFFSNGKGNGSTMTAKDPNKCDLHSDNDWMTPNDIALVKKFYNCSFNENPPSSSFFQFIQNQLNQIFHQINFSFQVPDFF